MTKKDDDVMSLPKMPAIESCVKIKRHNQIFKFQYTSNVDFDIKKDAISSSQSF